MLTEQRYQIILDLLKEKKSVTATELKEILDTSESTVRRDITALHKAGKLIKVFGSSEFGISEAEIRDAVSEGWKELAVIRMEMQKKGEEVLKYDYPYADGYKGFWENPIALQHPLAVSEIVVWDGSLILVISKKSEVVNALIENNTFAQDLEKYNME